MTAETLISGFPMAYLFALTLGALLALLACCRIAELEKAEISASKAEIYASTARPGQAAGEADSRPVSEKDGA